MSFSLISCVVFVYTAHRQPTTQQQYCQKIQRQAKTAWGNRFGASKLMHLFLYIQDIVAARLRRRCARFSSSFQEERRRDRTSCSDRGDLRAGVKPSTAPSLLCSLSPIMERIVRQIMALVRLELRKGRLVSGFCLGHRRRRDARRLDRVLLMLLFHALLLPFPAQRPVESIISQFNGERCCFKICLNRSVAPSSAGRPAHMLSRSGKTEDRRAEQSRDRSLRTEVIFWEQLFRACSLGKSELKGAEGLLGAFGVRVELRKQPRIELCEARFPFVHIRVLLPSKVFDPMLR